MTRKPGYDGDGARLYDCAVIGAGPAGLTAALYLTRFRRSVIVCDGGPSRAQWIPESQNCPGFPGGISGHRLLDRLRHQLSDYEAHVRAKRIDGLKRQEQGFLLVDADGDAVAARKVLLATGIVDMLPDVDWVEAAIGVGALRLCPVCDGFEARDQRIAVYGLGESALNHAEFLRTYSADVTLVCSDGQPLDDAQSRRAASLDVRVIAHSGDLRFDGHRCSFATPDGSLEAFDSLYAFLGCHAQSSLAEAIGAEADEDGALRVGRDQMTTVDGLYAAGDVVSALHQISVAVGHSGVAATAIHNALESNPRRFDEARDARHRD
ncbi:MAG TPA: NAD(P)/FAD-dependent oxidoreductase [Rhodanobacteraceae bacterium]|nr:NAD(P)/FAD-dependent oxidoreductase [Rhodanobacteraceae bacterium]